MDFKIISIGTLSVHELWTRQTSTRTPHATTTLIQSANQTILVDPGLPPTVIEARLAERAGLEPKDITDVFLTNFRPSHRLALPLFNTARWLISTREREEIGRQLVQCYQDEQEDSTRDLLREEIAILKRFTPAPDQIAPQVDLFPLPGYTAGTSGLLLSHPHSTILIAGDAVPTVEHMEHGRVLRGAFDIQQAQTSLAEAIEIADLIVPGHDNVVANPLTRHRVLPPT